MRCPSCLDEYEPDVVRCAACDVELVTEEELDGDAAAQPRPRPARPDLPTGPRPLGRFHPDIVPQVLDVLREQGVEHDVRTRDDDVEVAVEAGRRDELRAELLMRWDDLLAELDADLAPEVLASGEHAAGWLDAPMGSYIDRDGKLVVDAPPEDDADDRRTLGPTLVAGGAILALAGWQVLDVGAVIIAGVGIALLGLFIPR